MHARNFFKPLILSCFGFLVLVYARLCFDILLKRLCQFLCWLSRILVKESNWPGETWWIKFFCKNGPKANHVPGNGKTGQSERHICGKYIYLKNEILSCMLASKHRWIRLTFWFVKMRQNTDVSFVSWSKCKKLCIKSIL